jgi:thioredoxin 1
MKKLILASLAIYSIGFAKIDDVRNQNELNKAFEENNQIVVVDVSATWCGACQDLAPKLQQLDKEYNGLQPNFIKIVDVDVDASEKAFVNSFKTKYIPLLVQYKKNNEGKFVEVKRQVGSMSFDSLKKWATN